MYVLFGVFVQTLKLIAVSNAMVRQIFLVDSKAFHIHVTDCRRVHIYDVKITSPEESPNTDGVHISTSTGIKVTDSFIGVGDDCVSIGDGTKNVLVSRVYCGPGHGIRYCIHRRLTFFLCNVPFIAPCWSQARQRRSVVLEGFKSGCVYIQHFLLINMVFL